MITGDHYDADAGALATEDCVRRGRPKRVPNAGNAKKCQRECLDVRRDGIRLPRADCQEAVRTSAMFVDPQLQGLPH
jgi:hypothetical protein